MDQDSKYRHSYENKRLDEAYHAFVCGEGSLRQLVKSSKLSLRTLQRYSSRDSWVEELEARKAALSAEVSVLSQMAAVAPDDAIVAPDDAKGAIVAVLRRQQRFWDRIDAHVTRALEDAERRAAESKRPLSYGQLIPLLNVAEKASVNLRKAYGIPDVTRMEFEDKTPALRHAERIRANREKRMAQQPAAPAPAVDTEVPN